MSTSTLTPLESAMCAKALDDFESELGRSIQRLENASGRTVYDDMTLVGVAAWMRGTLDSIRHIRGSR